MAYSLHKVFSNVCALLLCAYNPEYILSGPDNRVMAYSVLYTRELKYNFLQKGPSQ